MTEPTNIHEALLKFHSLFHGAEKTGLNPHFKSKHFSLDDVIKATTPVLQKCGLYIYHQVAGNDLVTTICNAEGEVIISRVPMPQNANPQVTGSNMTYFKRYNICCLLNVAEADDDGNAGAMAADLAESKAKAGPIVPKPPATTEQKDALLLYLASDLPDKRQSAYLKKNMDVFTEMDAKGLLDKINAQMENAK
jgi:hypothetical protein